MMSGSILGILKAGIWVLRVIYAPMKIRPVKNKITILSRQSDSPSMDIALLEDYLKKNYPGTRLKIMCRKLERGSGVSYGLHILKQMWNIADSPVVLLDGYCIAASILKHREETKIVQMWHAMAAIKEFGYQTLDKEGGHSGEIAEVMCMHRNYYRILAPSRATGGFFCEAFGAEESKLLYMGLPRIDVLSGQRDDPEGPGENLRALYEIQEDREIILWAPTFRKAGKLRMSELINAIDTDRFTLVICPHPQDKTPEYSEEAGEREVIIDRNHDTLDWLAVCDRLITDYSAISVEAAVADKPLYFYVYDIDEYKESEGLNLDPRKEAPLVTSEDPEDMARILSRNYPWEELKKFRNNYVEIDTHNCTGRLGEYLVGLTDLSSRPVT